MYTLIIIASVYHGNIVTMHGFRTKQACEQFEKEVVEMMRPLSFSHRETEFKDGRRTKCVKHN
jgi:hypothetical protein